MSNNTLFNSKTFAKIRNVNPALANKIDSQHGFVSNVDLPALIEVDRLMLLLVRCGNGRFLTPAQDVTHFMTIIEEHAQLKSEKEGVVFAGDHVRDVSLPVDY